MLKAILPLFVALPLLGACYTYVPVDPAMVLLNQSLRVRLTEEASRRMEVTRDPETPIEGRVFELGDGQFRLLPGSSTGGSTAPVLLDFGDLSLVELREVDETRTWILAGTGITGGVLLLLSVNALPFGGGGGTNTPDFFIRLPIGF